MIILLKLRTLITFECLHYMQKKVSGQHGYMAMKFDMAKAMIEWSGIF